MTRLGCLNTKESSSFSFHPQLFFFSRTHKIVLLRYTILFLLLLLMAFDMYVVHLFILISILLSFACSFAFCSENENNCSFGTSTCCNLHTRRVESRVNWMIFQRKFRRLVSTSLCEGIAPDRTRTWSFYRNSYAHETVQKHMLWSWNPSNLFDHSQKYAANIRWNGISLIIS